MHDEGEYDPDELVEELRALLPPQTPPQAYGLVVRDIDRTEYRMRVAEGITEQETKQGLNHMLGTIMLMVSEETGDPLDVTAQVGRITAEAIEENDEQFNYEDF